MTDPQDHTPFEELAAGHALSALEPEEEQVFLQHLATCSACQSEVQQHAETTGLLALAADPVDPPPSVLEGIRAGMAAQRTAEVEADRRAAPPPPAAAAGPAEVTPIGAARARRSGRTPRAVSWLGAAAAAALLLSLGAWNLALRGERDDARQYGDRLAAAVGQIAEPDSQSVRLSGEDGSVLAVAVVQDGEVSLVVDGLQPNASGTSYVLWAQDRSGGVRPVGAFDVAQSQVDVVDDLPVEGGVESVTAYLVSNEPGDEPPATPGGPVVARGQA